MPAITVRHLSDETHRALKARAAAHGRSTEAEVREILRDAVLGDPHDGFGTRVWQVARQSGGFDLDIDRGNSETGPVDLS